MNEQYLIYSISSHPSGMGEKFYTELFKQHNIDYRYITLPSRYIGIAVNSIRDQRLRGFSVSMPFKQGVIAHLDYQDPVVKRFNSCNTVLSIDNKLHGYNTDYFGALYIISLIDPSATVSILGAGSMGTMFKELLQNRAEVFSRSMGNWDKRHKSSDVIINCTSLGTITNSSPYDLLPSTSLVVDLTVNKLTQLEQQCIKDNVKYINGFEFYKRQFVKQFEIYTSGIFITPEDLDNIK